MKSAICEVISDLLFIKAKINFLGVSVDKIDNYLADKQARIGLSKILEHIEQELGKNIKLLDQIIKE